MITYVAFPDMSEELLKPCLLCDTKLPSEDYDKLHAHLVEEHKVVKGFEFLFKLFQLNNENLQRISISVSEILAECEDIFETSKDNLDSNGNESLAFNPAEILEIKTELDEDEIGFLGLGRDVTEHGNDVKAEFLVDTGQNEEKHDSPSNPGIKGARYTPEERKFCVDNYRAFGFADRRQKGWYDRFSVMFRKRFPNASSVPSKHSCAEMNKKFEKYKTLEDQCKGKSGRQVKDRTNICDECGFVGNGGRQDIYNHKKRHHAPWKECLVCGKKVFDLKMHSQFHLPENERRFKCEQCGKGFCDRSHLKQHVKSVHSDERPHVCQYMCGYSCKCAGNLRKHERICKNNVDK